MKARGNLQFPARAPALILQKMYRTLDADRILETAERLQARISERFPASGLSKVCGEVQEVAEESKRLCHDITRPRIGLRILVGLAVVIILAGLVESLILLEFSFRDFDLLEFIQVLEAGLNAVVLIGAAVVFLITVESRLKRSRLLAAVRELRALAHVIDMHQLTKDPHRLLRRVVATSSSPRQTMTADELGRYLDYCSEMLSILGKLAALYVQSFSDTAVLTAVNEVEGLTTGLSRKIWQKIMLLHRLVDTELGNGKVAASTGNQKS